MNINFKLPFDPTAAASCISAAVGISGVVLIGPVNNNWIVLETKLLCNN